MHTIDRLLGETLEKFLPTKKCFVGKYWFRQTTVLHLEKVFLFSAPRGTVRAILEKNSRRGGGPKQLLLYSVPVSPQFPLFLPPSASQRRKGEEMSAWHDRRGRRKEKVALAVLTQERREGEEAERHFLFLPPQFFMPKNLLLLRPPGTLVMRERKRRETKGSGEMLNFLLYVEGKWSLEYSPKNLSHVVAHVRKKGGLLDGIWDYPPRRVSDAMSVLFPTYEWGRENGQISRLRVVRSN